MNGKYPLSFLRRVGRRWPERIQFLEQIRGQIILAAERTSRFFNDEVSRTPIPVRTVADRRRLNQRRSRD
jgi:hypothetical protein